MPSDLHVGPFDASQTATLRAFADRLVPTDELGPGALPAGAVEYVGQALAGDYAHLLPAYVAGLTSLDATARDRHGAAFADIAPADQDALLSELELGASAAAFFELVRRHAIEGMFADPATAGRRGPAGGCSVRRAEGLLHRCDQALGGWVPDDGAPTWRGRPRRGGRDRRARAHAGRARVVALEAGPRRRRGRVRRARNDKCARLGEPKARRGADLAARRPRRPDRAGPRSW